MLSRLMMVQIGLKATVAWHLACLPHVYVFHLVQAGKQMHATYCMLNLTKAKAFWHLWHTTYLLVACRSLLDSATCVQWRSSTELAALLPPQCLGQAPAESQPLASLLPTLHMQPR